MNSQNWFVVFKQRFLYIKWKYIKILRPWTMNISNTFWQCIKNFNLFFLSFKNKQTFYFVVLIYSVILAGLTHLILYLPHPASPV